MNNRGFFAKNTTLRVLSKNYFIFNIIIQAVYSQIEKLDIIQKICENHNNQIDILNRPRDNFYYIYDIYTHSDDSLPSPLDCIENSQSQACIAAQHNKKLFEQDLYYNLEQSYKKIKIVRDQSNYYNKLIDKKIDQQLQKIARLLPSPIYNQYFDNYKNIYNALYQIQSRLIIANATYQEKVGNGKQLAAIAIQQLLQAALSDFKIDQEIFDIQEIHLKKNIHSHVYIILNTNILCDPWNFYFGELSTIQSDIFKQFYNHKNNKIWDTSEKINISKISTITQLFQKIKNFTPDSVQKIVANDIDYTKNLITADYSELSYKKAEL